MTEQSVKDECQRVVMTGRRNLVVSGVEDVDCFDEDKVVAYTTEGTMTVKGVDFHINRLNVENGILELEGEIDSIEYSAERKNEKGSILCRIFR